jgi:hypothetical protein
MICFNRFTGVIIWQKDILSFGIAPSNFPMVDSTSIYVNDVNKNQVSSFDIHSGQKRWTTNLPNKFEIDSRMYILGNYIIAHSEYDPTTQSEYMYVIQKNSGILIKSIEVSGFYNSIVADADGVYATTYLKTAKFAIPSLERNWYTETPLKARVDSSRNIFSFYSSSELIATKTYLLSQYFAEMRNTPECETSFTFIDKKTGEIMKSYSSKNCHGLQWQKFVYVVGNEAYYPSQSGLANVQL